MLSMSKKLWQFCIVGIVVGLMFVIIGCSNSTGKEADESANDNNVVSDDTNDEGASNGDEPEEQIEISMMMHWGEGIFEEKFNDHIKKALPHIKLTLIEAEGTEEMQNAFAKGLIPDIAMGSNFGRYEELGLLMDQMPLIESSGLDLSLYDQGVIDSLKNASPVGELNALPVIKQGYVMTYNKDIFDAFAVPYPTDYMTWDEVIELGKKLSGEIDGKKYHEIGRASCREREKIWGGEVVLKKKEEEL